MLCSHPQWHLPLYVLPHHNPRLISSPPSYGEARSEPMFSTCFLTFLIIVETFTQLMIVLAVCGLSYKVNRVDVTCQSIKTSESDKSSFNKFLGHEKCSFSASLSPCFRMSFLKRTKYPVTFVKQNFTKFLCGNYQSFCSHPTRKYSYRLEAMDHWKHLTGKPQHRFHPSTQTSSVKSSCAHFFPHMANIGVRILNFFPYMCQIHPPCVFVSLLP